MKPIIGVTASVMEEKSTTVANDNIDSITGQGGVPVILPNLLGEEEVEHFAKLIDGLLVTGGGDIDPTLFGEEPHPNLGGITPERDFFEILLIQKLLKQNKPILAVCRGCQILNIAAGGDMFQDIYAQNSRQLLQHQQRAPRSHVSHYINVEEDSLLSHVVQHTRFKVNSFHHQAVRYLAKSFKLSASSSDGIIEAFESMDHRFVLGIQWHPESLVKKGDSYSMKIFQSFIEASKA